MLSEKQQEGKYIGVIVTIYSTFFIIFRIKACIVYLETPDRVKEIDTKMKVRVKLSIILGLTVMAVSIITTLFGSYAINSIAEKKFKYFAESAC